MLLEKLMICYGVLESLLLVEFSQYIWKVLLQYDQT